MILSPSRILPSLAAMLFGSIWGQDGASTLRWADLPATEADCSQTITNLTDVDPGLVFIVGPVTDCQAELVLNVVSVQINFLHRGNKKKKKHLMKLSGTNQPTSHLF